MYTSTHITGKKARQLVDKGALLIDVRTPVLFRDGTLPGAINISARQVSELLKYPKNKKMVFFGDDNTATDVIVNYVTGLGFTDVFSFGLMENWNK